VLGNAHASITDGTGPAPAAAKGDGPKLKKKAGGLKCGSVLQTGRSTPNEGAVDKRRATGRDRSEKKVPRTLEGLETDGRDALDGKGTKQITKGRPGETRECRTL